MGQQRTDSTDKSRAPSHRYQKNEWHPNDLPASLTIIPESVLPKLRFTRQPDRLPSLPPRFASGRDPITSHSAPSELPQAYSETLVGQF